MTEREQRRAAERDRQITAILDVALRAFAESGFSGTSMKDVASRSGFSVGHIYNLIGNKAALFDTVMLREGSLLYDRIAAAEDAHSGDLVGAINAIVDTSLSFFDDHREFYEIYLRHSGGMRANVERMFSPPLVDLNRQLDERVKRLFRRAASAGLTGNLAVSDMAMALGELTNGFIAAWAAAGYKGRVSGKSKVVKQLLWNGIGA